MKRTVEYTLMIISAVVSLIGIIFGFVFQSLVNSPDFVNQFKSEFENTYNEQVEQAGGTAQNISAEQALDTFASVSNYGLIVLAISLILTIVAIIFIKKQRILSGVLAIVAGLLSIFTLNIISFLLLIIAAIMLFVRKNKSNQQFEDVNFQNDVNDNENNLNSNQNQQTFDEQQNKKNKDDDPYIY
ncbi:DUF4064 domain-containing protein [Mammaliicoccus lentus]|uniref:DUF4064 domain-containing protein n=1 Tax=Mammaliicoccus lentus TaxID=42858 RepID=UPI002DB6B418|nr:DUF4064 domain-containing protein [Mammaliicoccus lentus]MEB8092913.1 DUF4064 domain-containing protein [Mammaliicoccus lentus]